MGATILTNVPKLQQWLCWWAEKSTHIAYFPLNELDLKEEALVPTTNFTENVHSSTKFLLEWSQGKIELYTATMDDMVRFVLQQQFYRICFSLVVKHVQVPLT